MKLKRLLSTVAALVLPMTAAHAQTILADWTFETTQPVTAGPFSPEVGSGSALGHHASGAAVYSTPVGNGSAHSFSANTWGIGDYYQFSVNAATYKDFIVTYCHNGSATGPRDYNFQYSTDGSTFTTFATYQIPSGVTWGSAAGSSNASTFYYRDLRTITTLNNKPTVYFRLAQADGTAINGSAVASAGTDRVDNFTVWATLGAAGGGPSNLVVNPSSITTNAGSTVAYTVSADGTTPSYSWYKSPSTLIPSATGATLTLSSVTAADTASYFVILSNAGGMATSAPVSLNVIDPAINAQPNSVQVFVDNTATFTVGAGGTGLSYQWYFTDGSGTIIAPVSDGTQASGSTVAGSHTTSLSFSNSQLADSTNLVVVVTGTDGSVTSSVVNMNVVLSGILTFWNFNGIAFSNNIANPVPYIGTGTALAIGSPNTPGTSPFSGSVDPEDGIGTPFPGGQNLPNLSWGTSHYPLTGGNKQNGIQFNVSTVGVKDVVLSYDSRPSSTGSMYERVQFTTNGTDWIDYPTSSTFHVSSAIFRPFVNDFTGFSNVANNPSFGVRIVTEYQTTATYGVVSNDNYVGAFNTYSSGGSGGFSAGTLTYDLVAVSATAITNTYSPPTITGFSNVTTPDYVSVSMPFTIGSATTPVNLLTVTAESLDPSFGPALNISGTAPNLTLQIPAQSINANVVAAPIAVTVADTNGDKTTTWFDLTVTSKNLPPTNSLTGLSSTSVLANSSITIPFVVTDDNTPSNGQSFTFSATSDDDTVIPSGNINVTQISPSNYSVTITPNSNHVGFAQIAVTAFDNDTLEPKSTTANIQLNVVPNTNVMLIDYFAYNTGGSLDNVAAGYWNHLSGGIGQLQVIPDPAIGYALVDTANNTENLQVQLLGAPYAIGSGQTLYASYQVTMNPLFEPNGMPSGAGSYFTVFNDGSGTTGNYECRLIAATNGAAPGNYRLGINNFGASSSNAVMYPMDLVPGNTYVVVTALTLANGSSSLWINPTNASSFHVTDVSTGTLFNISDFELRESGAASGAVGVGNLKIGTTFDSVFPSLQTVATTPNLVLTWSDPSIALQSATYVAGPYVTIPGAQPPYTNYAGTNAATFFKLGSQ